VPGAAAVVGLGAFSVIVVNLTGSPLPAGCAAALGLGEHACVGEKATPAPGTWREVTHTPTLQHLQGSSGSGGNGKGKKGGGREGVYAAPAVPALVVALAPPRCPAGEAVPGKWRERERSMLRHLASAASEGWQARHPNVPLVVVDDMPHTLCATTLDAHTLAARDAVAKAAASWVASPPPPVPASSPRGNGGGGDSSSPRSMEPRDVKGLPVVVVVAILALPPGGGKSSFMDQLKARVGATIVSSDDCNKVRA